MLIHLQMTATNWAMCKSAIWIVRLFVHFIRRCDLLILGCDVQNESKHRKVSSGETENSAQMICFSSFFSIIYSIWFDSIWSIVNKWRTRHLNCLLHFGQAWRLCRDNLIFPLYFFWLAFGLTRTRKWTLDT